MLQKSVKEINNFVMLCLTLLLAVPSFALEKHDCDLFWLTLLHNNDDESQLINAGRGLEDFGGAARFMTVVSKARGTIRSSARGQKNQVQDGCHHPQLG